MMEPMVMMMVMVMTMMMTMTMMMMMTTRTTTMGMRGDKVRMNIHKMHGIFFADAST